MGDENRDFERALDMPLPIIDSYRSVEVSSRRSRERGNIYSGSKFLHHPERFRTFLERELEISDTGSSDKKVTPIMIEGHFNTRACDHDCFGNLAGGCGGNWTDKNMQWTLERGMQFFDQLQEAGVKSMSISGGGEPMLHPNFYDFLERGSEFLDMALITHGGRIQSLDDARFIVRNTKWVRVSLGGAKTETFMKRHGIDEKEVERCWRGLGYLVQAKRELLDSDSGEDLSLINVGFITNETVASETYAMAERSKEMGADSISVRPDHYSTHDSTALIEEARRVFQDEKFSIFFPYMKFQKMEEQVRKENPLVVVPHKCLFSTVVSGDGHGFVDCYNVNRRWADYGSVFEGGFDKVWGSEKTETAIRSLLRRPETHYRSFYDATSAALADFRKQYLAEKSESKRADLVESWISGRDENVEHVNFINN